MAVANPVTQPDLIVQGEWTYDDYLALPDDGNRYEIIAGVLYMVNAPNLDHQFVVFELSRQLGNFVLEHKLGYVLIAPFEVHLSEATRPVQPDILFIKNENWPGSGAKFFDGPPDLVVEVISPSSIRMDQVVKFSAYEQASIPEYWLLNPVTRSVEVFTLSGSEYALQGLYIEDQIIESLALKGLQIVNSSLFAPK